MFAEGVLRNTVIECVLCKAFFAGYESESIPRNYHAQMTRLRTDTAIALRNGDDCRRQHFEPDPSAMTPTFMFNHRSS